MRITINNTTIELPTDMNVSIVDGMITVRHSASKVLDKIAYEEKEPDEPELKRGPYKKKSEPQGKLFPANTDALIMRHLRAYEGKRYTVGIAKHLTKVLDITKYTHHHQHALKAILADMVADGRLVILKGEDEGSRLYGLASMQAKVEPVTEVNGEPIYPT